MAGQDFRLTAILAVRDMMTPVMKQVSARWGNFRKVIDSTQFKNLQKQVALFNRSMQNVAATAGDVAGKIGGPFLARRLCGLQPSAVGVELRKHRGCPR